MKSKKQTRRSLFLHLAEFLQRVLRRNRKPEPEDPYAYRTSPVRRGPRGRSGAAAVAEPEEEQGFYPPPPAISGSRLPPSNVGLAKSEPASRN